MPTRYREGHPDFRNTVATSFASGELLDQVIEDVRAGLVETSAEITRGQLPTIRGYETEFRQLLQDLIVNAIKFRRPGKSPNIEIGARRVTGAWEFFVRDNGIGIEPMYHEKILYIFSGYTTTVHTRGLAWAWPTARRSSVSTAARFGWRQTARVGPRCTSPSPPVSAGVWEIM